MINKFLIFCFLFSGLNQGHAGVTAFPDIPNGCFDQDVYCSHTQVLEIDGDKNIRIEFFATADLADYPLPQDVVNKYFAFDHWEEYTADSNAISVQASALLKMEGAYDQLIQYSRYINDGPFPISKIRVREVTLYQRIPHIEGADISYTFSLLPGTFNNLPEVDDKYKSYDHPDGVQKKEGEIHVKYLPQEERYVMYIRADIVPTIKLLPNVAAKFIERSFVAVSKGMLNH